MRDITLGITFYHDFTTRAFATGIPGTLGGTPVLSVLEENNATPITAGVSVSVDRASVVGLNEATIVATGGNGYEAGKSYSIYISTGTVGGVSVVGEVVGQFTVGQSAAAVDLANVTDGLGALKTLVDTVNTDLSNATDGLGALKTLIDTVNTDLSNGTDGLGALKTLIDTVNTDLSNGTDGLGAIKTSVDAIPTTAMRGTDGALTDKAGFSLSTAGILAVWHQALTAVVTAGSVGKLLKDEITAVRMATLTDWINGGRLDLLLDAIPTTAMRGTDSAATAASLATAQLDLDTITGADGAILLAATQASIDAIEADTNELQVDDVPGLIAALNDLSSANILTQVDAALDTAIAELAQAAPSATPTLRTGLMLLYMALRNRLDVNTSGAPDVLNIYNNAGTVIAKKQLSDDGSDYSEVEMETGP